MLTIQGYVVEICDNDDGGWEVFIDEIGVKIEIADGTEARAVSAARGLIDALLERKNHVLRLVG